MCYQSQKERRFAGRTHKIGIVHNPKYDKEMSLVANLVSEHACELMSEQYTYALNGRAQYAFYEPVPGIIFIKNE